MDTAEVTHQRAGPDIELGKSLTWCGLTLDITDMSLDHAEPTCDRCLEILQEYKNSLGEQP